MSNIQDLLALILSATRGDQVRDSIVDAIQMCYDDGKAGSVDLQARRLIEGVISVNEDQTVEINAIRAIIDDMQGGGSEGGESGTVTTDIPSFIFESGTKDSISVANKHVTNVTVDLTENFTQPPVVFCMIAVQTTASYPYGSLQVVAIKSSITTSQFRFAIANNTGTDRSVTVEWFAIQPTTITVETDITVPATDDLTEAQIQSLIGLLD